MFKCNKYMCNRMFSREEIYMTKDILQNNAQTMTRNTRLVQSIYKKILMDTHSKQFNLVPPKPHLGNTKNHLALINCTSTCK